MEKLNKPKNKFFKRRQRQHEILIALINQQQDLELMDGDIQNFNPINANENDPAEWINRNRRIIEKYQALVRSAITLDALLDSEENKSE